MPSKQQRGRGGFTLIELLVVVVIIGILASVAMPSFADAQDRARNAAMQSNVGVIRTGLEAYAGDHQGRYPHDGPASTPDSLVSTTAGQGFLADGYLPGNAFPKAPWNTERQTTVIAFNTSTPAAGCGERVPEPGEVVGAGAAVARPTLLTHYGALVYDTWSTNALGPQQLGYVVHGIGKKRKQAVIALSKATRPE